MTGPVLCDRCGKPAGSLDVTTLGGPRREYLYHCETPGCVDEFGSAAVEPPDVPGHLTREDRRWLRKHRQLADELAGIERRLLRESNV